MVSFFACSYPQLLWPQAISEIPPQTISTTLNHYIEALLQKSPDVFDRWYAFKKETEQLPANQQAVFLKLAKNYQDQLFPTLSSQQALQRPKEPSITKASYPQNKDHYYNYFKQLNRKANHYHLQSQQYFRHKQYRAAWLYSFLALATYLELPLSKTTTDATTDTTTNNTTEIAPLFITYKEAQPLFSQFETSEGSCPAEWKKQHQKCLIAFIGSRECCLNLHTENLEKTSILDIPDDDFFISSSQHGFSIKALQRHIKQKESLQQPYQQNTYFSEQDILSLCQRSTALSEQISTMRQQASRNYQKALEAFENQEHLEALCFSQQSRNKDPLSAEIIALHELLTLHQQKTQNNVRLTTNDQDTALWEAFEKRSLAFCQNYPFHNGNRLLLSEIYCEKGFFLLQEGYRQKACQFFKLSLYVHCDNPRSREKAQKIEAILREEIQDKRLKQLRKKAETAIEEKHPIQHLTTFSLKILDPFIKEPRSAYQEEEEEIIFFCKLNKESIPEDLLPHCPHNQTLQDKEELYATRKAQAFVSNANYLEKPHHSFHIEDLYAFYQYHLKNYNNREFLNPWNNELFTKEDTLKMLKQAKELGLENLEEQSSL